MLKRRCKHPIFVSKYDLGIRISRERKRALKRLLPFCSGLNKNMVTRMNIQLDGMTKYWKSDKMK